MNDRELLEFAAKAAGIKLLEWGGIGCWSGENDKEGYQIYPSFDRWNPLTDDGDALRLAVKLGIEICFENSLVTAKSYAYSDGVSYVFDIDIYESLDDDKYAATRRAIVRAAAAIGESLCHT